MVLHPIDFNSVDRYKVIKGKLCCDPLCEEQENGYGEWQLLS